jgi:hypothetical protein
MKIVQKRLGHKDIQTTLNLNSHITEEDDKINLCNLVTKWSLLFSRDKKGKESSIPCRTSVSGKASKWT